MENGHGLVQRATVAGVKSEGWHPICLLVQMVNFRGERWNEYIEKQGLKWGQISAAFLSHAEGSLALARLKSVGRRPTVVAVVDHHLWWLWRWW